MYSLHIEYDYFGQGDCLDLSTLNDTYISFEKQEERRNQTTFAVEEPFKIAKEKRQIKWIISKQETVHLFDR